MFERKLGYILLPLSAILFFSPLKELHYAQLSKGWFHTDGEILKFSSIKDRESINKYVFLITYKYTAKEDSYTGHRYQFGFSVFTKEEIEKLEKQYQVGNLIRVYYKFDSPSISCIKNGRVSRFTYYIIFSGIVSFYTAVRLILKENIILDHYCGEYCGE